MNFHEGEKKKPMKSNFYNIEVKRKKKSPSQFFSINSKKKKKLTRHDF